MSKLSKDDKQYLRDTLRPQAKKFRVMVFQYPGEGVTVAIKKTGSDMAAFSVSIAGVEEPKFRAKTGEYHALSRMFDHGNTLPTKLAGRTLEEAAKGIAYMLS